MTVPHEFSLALPWCGIWLPVLLWLMVVVIALAFDHHKILRRVPALQSPAREMDNHLPPGVARHQADVTTPDVFNRHLHAYRESSCRLLCFTH